MSEYLFIGDKINVPALRDYFISHRIDAGDSVVINRHDYHELIEEIKASGDGFPDIPLKVLGVIITPDPTDSVPIGKVQIVKNDKQY